MYEIPSVGKFTDAWQTDFFPNFSFHTKPEGIENAEVDAQKSMDRCAAEGDMMNYKKFKAQLK